MPLATGVCTCRLIRLSRITETPERVYVAANNALFYYNKNDNSVQSLSKVNGMSDIAINVVKYNAFNNTTVVGYANGNIDLFKNNTIINVADINAKPLQAAKALIIFILSISLHTSVAVLEL